MCCLHCMHCPILLLPLLSYQINDLQKSFMLKILKKPTSFRQFHLTVLHPYSNTMTGVDLSGDYLDSHYMRKAYKVTADALLEDNLTSRDPITLFTQWFNHAKEHATETYEEANAIALATATKAGKPSIRMVLLKAFGPDGFRFFTNYESRKGDELSENSQASMMMYWHKINRSVRIEGTVEKATNEISEEYWAKRPFSSKASAAISRQSVPVPSRNYLENEVEALREKCLKEEMQVPKPENWGGYVLIPNSMEFWQGQSDRLHDRFLFTLTDNKNLQHAQTAENGWIMQRLAP